MTTKLKKILKKRDEFSVFDVYKNRQKRLKDLVDVHGVEHVAIAGDWTENTVRQYVRVSNPVSISDLKLEQAETVLKGL